MLVPAEKDLVAYSRWTAFVTTVEIEEDLTGATFEMHIRQNWNGSGAALIDLDTVTTASAEGVRFIAYEAAADGVMVSKIGVRINETSMEDPAKIPLADPRDDDLALVYDLHITPSGGTKQVWLRGQFIVKGGSTQ